MRFIVVVLTLVTVVGIQSASGAPILDQSCCAAAGGRADFGSFTRVQTFTAGLTGLFTGIDLGLQQFTPGPLPTFELYFGAFSVGDDPSAFGAPLTTLSLTDTGVPIPSSGFGGSFYSADISGAAIFVMPGQQFSIVQRPGSGGGWIVGGLPPYTGGTFLTTTTGSSVLIDANTDAIFRTFVDQPAAVPEPGSMLLLGIGTACLAARRRQRNRA